MIFFEVFVALIQACTSHPGVICCGLKVLSPWIMPVKAVVFDFDSTISTPTFLERAGQWAVADKKDIFKSMSTHEIVANFGGATRIEALKGLLATLKAADIVLYIVSIGFREAFMPHLEAVGLLPFFQHDRIFGQDSPELRQLEFVKGRLIARFMADAGWNREEVLFIDDSREHIERASAVCTTLLVSKAKVGGLSETELSQIREIAAER